MGIFVSNFRYSESDNYSFISSSKLLVNESYKERMCHQVDVQYLAVSHKGVMLVRREKSLPTDYLKVTTA